MIFFIYIAGCVVAGFLVWESVDEIAIAAAKADAPVEEIIALTALAIILSWVTVAAILFCGKDEP